MSGKTADDHKKELYKRRLCSAYLLVNFLVISLLLLGFIYSCLGADNIHYYPPYARIDLGPVLERLAAAQAEGTADPEDYDILLHQTGLGRPAAEELLFEKGLTAEQALKEIAGFQADFFAPVALTDLKIGIVTASNKVTDGSGQLANGFKIAGLKDGDVLISEATHTFGWRHGHAAIVVDAKNRKILEAALWGYNSQINSVDYWRHYASFIQLRLKATPEGEPLTDPAKTAADIAALARQYLYDMPYGLLTGIPTKAQGLDVLAKTQCAHLVWYPFYQFGYDIDSDGTWLVTPRDIANSPYFEIVQVYGVDPDRLWP